jgi:salicylate hydroxylase
LEQVSETADRRITIFLIKITGMGGLASALALAKKGFTNIHVYETASDLGFVGAGIQLAPNLARILDQLHVWAPIEAEATDVIETSIRQGSTDTELAHVDLSHIRKTYSHPHMTGHRVSLAGGLYKGCQQESEKITFHFSHQLLSIESFRPDPTFTIQPRDGSPTQVSCSLLLAADGVKSAARNSMLKHLDVTAKIIDTHQAAYRIMLPRSAMESDPDLKSLIDMNGVTRWIGEKRHIIAYPVQNHQIYNLSTAQPDVNFAAAPDATYTTKGSKEAMLGVFKDFCPRVQKMLNMVPDGEVCEWKLRVHEPLPTWVTGSFALVGDACHPTLPHLNQGAAQAVEDAAAIAVALDKCPSPEPEDLTAALKVYEKVRKDRAYLLVDLAAQSGRALHLGEGKAKEERDKAFAAVKEGGKVPDKWADADIQKMIYTFDPARETEERFDEYFKEAKAS